MVTPKKAQAGSFGKINQPNGLQPVASTEKSQFVLVHDGSRAGGEWLRKVETNANKLKRLGWKKSAALLVVVGVSRDAALTERAELAGLGAWGQPALTAPFVIALPGGGSVVAKAFDMKRDPTDTLTATGR